jgi:hypothetical protein
MQYCAALAKSYQHLGTPAQAALFYGEISPEWYLGLTSDERLLLDYLTLIEFNARRIEAMKEDEKKRDDEKNFPGIASTLPMDEIKARVEAHKRRRQGEF